MNLESKYIINLKLTTMKQGDGIFKMREFDAGMTLANKDVIILIYSDNVYYNDIKKLIIDSFDNVEHPEQVDAGAIAFDFDKLHPDQQSKLIAYVDYADEVIEVE